LAFLSLRWLEDLSHDSQFAIRSFAHSPAFTLAAVLTPAFGIGANTAFFPTAYVAIAAQRALRTDPVLTLRED
jgi:hypothetical protein